MKKILLVALLPGLLPFYIYTADAQKNKSKENKIQEIIIMRKGDKDSKITIETKGLEVYINGKPASEFKDDNLTVITKKRSGDNLWYSPGADMHIFSDDMGEKRAFLGVTTEEDDNGARITDIQKGSAAEKAGLKEGDIITKVGNRKIENPDDLMDAVTSYKPKDDVKIYYQRNGKSNDLKATLGEKTERFNAFAFNGPESRMKMDMFKDFNYNRDFQYQMPPTPPMSLGPVMPFNKLWRLGNKKLGVRIEDTENDTGAKITKVEESSVAEKAGLKKDDIITEVDGNKVKDVGEVLEQVRDNQDKSSYNIKAKRNGSEMSFDIKFPKKINNADL